MLDHITSWPRSLWYGLTLPFKAARIIMSDRILLLWSILPIILTLVLYFYGISELQNYLQGIFRAALIDWGLNADSWWAWFIMLIGKLVVFLIAALTFTFTSTLVASPFNDILAEKTEKHALLAPPPQGPAFEHFFKTLWIDLVKTIAASAAGILAFVFSLIPIVNIITFIVAFLLISFQYVSYPQTRRSIPLRESVRFLRKHFAACCGMGATIGFLYTIPLVSSFALPLAVVSGTLIVGRAEKGPFKLR